MTDINKEKYNKKIIARAIKDANFRNELKKNPKKVLERELEITFPSDFSIEVIEQPANKWIIVVPIVSDSSALSESELKNVAGGGTWGCTINTCYPFCHH